MITFEQYLKEISVNSQNDPEGTNQAILGIIAKYGGGGLNFDASNLPPNNSLKDLNLKKKMKKKFKKN